MNIYYSHWLAGRPIGGQEVRQESQTKDDEKKEGRVKSQQPDKEGEGDG